MADDGDGRTSIHGIVRTTWTGFTGGQG